MSEAVDNAFEVEGGIVFYSDAGTSSGIFFGEGPAHEVVPDAPRTSLYFRGDGTISQRCEATADGAPTDWEPGATNGVGVGGGDSGPTTTNLPICLGGVKKKMADAGKRIYLKVCWAGGNTSHLAVFNYEVDVLMGDGVTKQLGLVI